ncbi:hypothetical protein KFE94_04905 [bacterium SCSIO 12643]|nr:hypothetical protein KFE94_04905 [bacterium SCSIO 12643]
MDSPHKELYEKHILSSEQFEYLDKIKSGRLISLYVELRTLLYLGVLLLSTGIGLMIYIHMENWGHLVLILGLTVLEIACIYYISQHIPPYSNEVQKPPTPYFDYILLLAALVFVSISSYVLIQYDLIEPLIKWSSLLTSFLFFYVAFRFDHRGILSLAITAFAAFWGLQVSFTQWYHSDFVNLLSLYNTGIWVGALFALTGYGLYYKNIKPHFSFTFKSFGLLLFFGSIVSASFTSDYWVFYALVALISGISVAVNSWKRQEYLFFIMGILCGYITGTRLLFEILEDLPFELWLMYFMASTGGIVFMIERIIRNMKKNRQL